MLKNFSASVLSFGIAVLGVGSAGCSDEESSAAFTLTSPAFQSGQALPEEYTCVGKNFPYSGFPPVDHVSPQLNWSAGPANTMSYAIVFKDITLTTGTPVNELGYHWAIYDIPASVRSLPKSLPSGNPITGVADAKQYSGPLFDDGFVGPCPSWSVAPGSPLLGATPAPTVSTDSYTFTVFALPTATITKPAERPAPAEGEPQISYVLDLDTYFIANAIGSTQLATTSNAQPAMFATPPAP